MRKYLIAALAFVCTSAFATDYNGGQCPAAPQWTFANCFGYGAGNGTSTWNFSLGNWYEYYGILAYTSTVSVKIQGGPKCVRGYGCVDVFIDSATIDGRPIPPTSTSNTVALLWVDLPAGPHTVTVISHWTGDGSTGNPAIAYWTGIVQDIQYTLQPLPPPPPCTSGCDD